MFYRVISISCSQCQTQTYHRVILVFNALVSRLFNSLFIILSLVFIMYKKALKVGEWVDN